MSEAGTSDTDDDLVDFVVGTAQDHGVVSGEHGSAARTGRRRAAFAVVGCFVLLAVACLIAGVVAWRDATAADAVADARQSRRAGTLILQALLNAETGQRGYLLARDPAYLAPYDESRSEFEQQLVALRTLSRDNPSRSGLTNAIERVAGAKFAELDRTIALAKGGRFDDAVANLRAGAGQALMNELRRAVDDLTAETTEDVTRITATQRSLGLMLAGAIVVALVCVAGLAALLLYDTRRYFGLLETREVSARHLAETLERRVARRTRDLAEVNQRFDVALRASGVTVMTQDRNLVFTWISQGVFGQTGQAIIGKAQQDVIPDQGQSAVANLNRGVIKSGEPARGDVRLIHDGAESWYNLTVHPLTDAHGVTTGIITGAIDITRYKEQEARIRLLMRELTHRSKNLLSVIQAIMRQTASHCDSIEDFETRFLARLQSLAQSHDLLVREDWQGAWLRELVASQLGHYIDRADPRIEVTGEPLRVRPDAAQHIGMAMHELATNAAKYGALSVPDGKVRVSWHVASGPDDAPMCYLSWEESDGPPVERPSHRGFGRVVIERTVARALNGEVHIDYAASGLRWTLEFPERGVMEEEGAGVA